MDTAAEIVGGAATGQIDPGQLATGLATAPLAWGIVVLLAAVAFLGRALLASYEKRLDAMQAAHEQTIATLTSVVTLGLKQAEAMDVLDKAIDRFTHPEA